MGAECGQRRPSLTWKVLRKLKVALLQPMPHMQRHVQYLNALMLQRVLYVQPPQPAPLLLPPPVPPQEALEPLPACPVTQTSLLQQRLQGRPGKQQLPQQLLLEQQRRQSPQVKRRRHLPPLPPPQRPPQQLPRPPLQQEQ